MSLSGQDGAPPGAVHRVVEVPQGRIHLVEQGSGPLVLLVHGFPESWYSWRHQLPALAAAGYRAAALDVRGYGRSSKPAEAAGYGMLAHVSDNTGVVRALGEETAVVVGHDWGSPIAAHSALLRPDVFRAVALLAVPYAPRGAVRPTEQYARLGSDAGEFYISYFQRPGVAEAEFETDVRGWLARVYAGLSGDTVPAGDPADLLRVPAGGRLADRLPGKTLPAWLSEADLDFYAGEFERTGLAGALARYRNVDRDWADLAAWHGAPVRQPSLFVGGELDPTLRERMPRALEGHRVSLPGLVSSHVLPGCGHWVQQERPDEVNRLLADWLRTVDAAS